MTPRRGRKVVHIFTPIHHSDGTCSERILHCDRHSTFPSLVAPSVCPSTCPLFTDPPIAALYLLLERNPTAPAGLLRAIQPSYSLCNLSMLRSVFYEVKYTIHQNAAYGVNGNIPDPSRSPCHGENWNGAGVRYIRFSFRPNFSSLGRMSICSSRSNDTCTVQTHV
ncbi:unnamed protein product [Mycena citricolor]|uniref:Uncharacterized protein n=1 Tax=Mycena citricolor TaxID=2018698 RepID=A0AAD2Q1K1_9AGAR|nr:unnamed protein product [Mycena citricolor]CAK5265898.1 unnamed protein product [Mycena citricolor]